MNFVERMKKSLSKTRENFTGKIEALIKNNRSLDDDFWEDVEDILIQADCGMKVTMNLVEKMKQTAKKNKIKESSQVLNIMQEEIANIIGRESMVINWAASGPTIIMVVGVNGVGKTTSIAKLAYRYKKEGRKVLLAAADTFRAAAIDQLQIWADRVGVDMIKHQEKADPGAVVFDALSAAEARKADILIIDTAGRLQNKVNLMNEIGKIRRIIERERPDAPHEVLLVLDATTGQNAVSQAQVFLEVSGITGIVLTKLDGTAKGGIVLALAQELNIPLKYVGIGEGLEDLRDFSPTVFAKALMYSDKAALEN
ncbi:MAG: signal recognition particle-docking protein FtsY [Syntrophomonadaceae bacterium]|nr:signal recognition particle-docking protein FtsY [Syntrophomonadaceae bacterium]